MNKSRLDSIDMVKGISIILVVAFHTDMPLSINKVLADFRMPLFFLLSGFLFSRKYVTDSWLLLKNRFKTLLVPYFTAAFLFFLLFVIRMMIDENEVSLLRAVVGIFYGISPDNWLIINIPLWFLVCLFCTQVIFGVVMRVTRNIHHLLQLLVFLAISVVGVLIGETVYLPWSFDVAMVCQIFMFTGYKLKELKILEKFELFSVTTLVLLILFAGASYYNARIDVGFRIYNSVLLFYLAGICGSITVFKVVSLFSSIKWVCKTLSYVGRESLIILIFHGGAFLYMMGVIGNRLGINIHWSISLIISIAGSLVIAEMIKRIPIANLLLNGKSTFKSL